MTRAKNTPTTRRRRKKILKQVKGYSIKTLKTAKEQAMRSLVYSYAHRKKRYPFFRSGVWIPRLNAGVRDKYDLNYSRFIHLKNLAQIKLDRQKLSEMAIEEPSRFAVLMEKLKTYKKKENSGTTLSQSP